MLDVHVLEARGVLFFQDLVEERLLEVGSLEAQDGNEALVVATVEHVVVHVASIVVDVDFLHDDILGRAHFGHQVNGNIFKTEVAIK